MDHPAVCQGRGTRASPQTLRKPGGRTGGLRHPGRPPQPAPRRQRTPLCRGARGADHLDELHGQRPARRATHGLYRRDQRPMVQRPAVRGLHETGVWRRRRGRPTGPVGRPDEGGLCRDLPQRVWLSLRLCRWGHDGLEREAEHDLCRGLRLLAPRRATEEGHRRYLHARTAHAQGTADALAQERGIQPDVCRTADAEGLRLPSGHGMALAGGILHRGLSETLQAVAHQLRGATDGGLRGPGAPTLRGHATRTLRRQPALQGTRGHLLRHERGRGAARQRIARKV